jgi:hypothetical protein
MIFKINSDHLKFLIMKKLSVYLIITIFVFAMHIKASAQSANTTLSNLVAPVKINQSLLPDINNKHNLGSGGKAWRNVYLDSAVYFNNVKFLSYTQAAANTATGFYALSSNPYGGYNTANGYAALSQNTAGAANAATGTFALYSNTEGSYNTANGYEALYYNTSGYDNIAIGYAALSSNQTGYYNTATGANALTSNISGRSNTAVGFQALLENNESFNTAVGTYSLYQTTASQFNTAVGYAAGDSYNNGYNNVFVGANTDVNGAGYYNDIAIGQGTICTDVSQARFGNSATTSIGGYANWTNISDGRVKKNIKQNVPGLAFINKLQPVTYNLDLNAADKIIQYQRKDSAGRIIPLTQVEQTARAAKEKIIYTGFIAQDVEKVAKSLSYDFSGVDAAKNNKDLYGLRYAEFVVPLVKAVQELSKMNDAKDSAIQQQNIKIDNLQQQIDELKKMIAVNQSQAVSNNLIITSSASLQQNTPNPFTSATNIKYSLPSSYSSAKIIVTDKNGNALKEINLSNSSPTGNINLNAATLASGAYQYSLYVDGKMIDTKQMILTK